VPREQLYRLAPATPKPARLDSLSSWDRARHILLAWWTWVVLALILEQTGWRITGLLGGAIGFILYHISPDTHPAAYALEPDFGAESAEFRTTMAGATGMSLVAGNRIRIF